ncbi:FabG Dehydrogenases with different specificities (related to short-chain alcohol dehydrogenases) [uncultured Caudovirales phage]|uniref:FabG Dehydrogenases with different specificities (Related to short-chain alcohol dehydrogenases) n=1 Tax=uncultured Caudovirales phage TaxID=2100421 RepID=A0A6J5MB00_9CAUD|nr:FabG Dehydrogenases with different specificities (related to short-chain alcohol dehydrogenases) [uncultured Caudovirales phage]
MKKILIIGGTGGLGNQVAKLMTNHNVTAIGSMNIDIRDMNACEHYFNENRFDVVINFAGVNYDSLIHKLTTDNENDIQNLLDVNIKGTINVVSSCLKSMRENRYGRIILISSVLSEKIIIGTAIYSSCKAFIDRFVKNISAENIKYGITANTLQLGYFDGGMTYKIKEEYLETVKNSIGLQRFGKIEEIVNTINYLIDNEYTTGINLKIDGNL